MQCPGAATNGFRRYGYEGEYNGGSWDDAYSMGRLHDPYRRFTQILKILYAIIQSPLNKLRREEGLIDNAWYTPIRAQRRILDL